MRVASRGGRLPNVGPFLDWQSPCHPAALSHPGAVDEKEKPMAGLEATVLNVPPPFTAKTRVCIVQTNVMIAFSQSNGRTTLSLRLCRNGNRRCTKGLKPTPRCMTLGSLRFITRKWIPRFTTLK